MTQFDLTFPAASMATSEAEDARELEEKIKKLKTENQKLRKELAKHDPEAVKKIGDTETKGESKASSVGQVSTSGAD